MFPKIRQSAWALTIVLLIACHVVLATWFYLTLPHGSRATSNLFWIGDVLSGMAIGLHGRRTLIRDICAFCLVVTSITIVMHFLAKALGFYVDMASTDYWPFAFLLLCLNVLFCLTGAAIGWNARRIFVRRP